MNFKQKTPRDPAYLKWIRKQRCCMCNFNLWIQAHHTTTGATSLKGSDLEAVPLCPQCHDKVHQGRKDGINNLQEIIIRLRDDYESHNEQQKENK